MQGDRDLALTSQAVIPVQVATFVAQFHFRGGSVTSVTGGNVKITIPDRDLLANALLNWVETLADVKPRTT